MTQELKGNNTAFGIKTYFYKQVKDIKFGIYAITLNKRKIYERLTKEKSRVYNFISRQVLDKIPFEKNKNESVELIIDKSMSKPEIAEFNSYIKRQLEGRLDPKTPLNIRHKLSHETPGLQAVDMFCWGIFEKYERGKTEWFDMYVEDKIILESQYL